MDPHISFPIWLLLIAAVGGLMHLWLKRQRLQRRRHYVAGATATLFLAMLCGAGDLPALTVLLPLALLFGPPIGLIFRALVGPVADARCTP